MVLSFSQKTQVVTKLEYIMGLQEYFDKLIQINDNQVRNKFIFIADVL